MKLGKSLIVTGLLFSSILGGMNVNNIVSYAADTNTTDQQKTEQKDVNIHFVDDQGKDIEGETSLQNKTVKIDDKRESIDLSDLKEINIPKIYRIKNSTSKIVKNDKGSWEAKVVLEKGEVVSLNYEGFENVQPADKAKLPKQMIIFDGLIDDSKITNIPVGYAIGGILKNADKTVTIKMIQATEEINVVYLLDGKVTSIEGLPNKVNVKKNSDTVDLNELNIDLNGFEIKNSQKQFSIERLNGHGTVHINLISGIQRPANTKNVLIIFRTNKTDAKTQVSAYSKDIDIESKTLSIKDINVPEGYTVKDTSFEVNKQDEVIVEVSKRSESNSNSNGSTVTKPTTKPTTKPSTTTPSNKHVVKVQDFKGTVATNPGQYVTLYNTEGKAIAGRRLAGDSNWAADKTMVRDGVKYYRVATNEWVKASDVYEYTVSNAVVETAAGNYKKLFDSKGNIVSNRGLAAGTKWMTDKVALIQGEKMYRVATNEWLKAVDVK
ncbi:SLAP domain-containing protein [Companilactobacillus sp. HBUAS59544]|uniref:SLAP domain-containing protein n=1 Tax=Companilactobacillus sp. HBUAS59544 TaxID=3109363 RepID=UPI002FF17CC0